MIGGLWLTINAHITGGPGRLSGLACLGLLLAACSSLPDYARPVTLSMEQLQMKDVISYRPLTRSDFKGEQPPPGFDERMGAAICAYFENNVDSGSYDFAYQGMKNYRHVYTVRLENPRIWALMDRDCSWWNPGVDEDLDDYVLDHEEVHFALFEITARQLTEELERTVFEISGSDENELKNDLRGQFETIWNRGRQTLKDRNLEFDEQTSAVFDPERQQEWLAQVRLELRATTAFSNTPRECAADAPAREALERAYDALRNTGHDLDLTALLVEAEAAARPPECDSVRARILADEVYRQSTE
jgi:hypothetical protein